MLLLHTQDWLGVYLDRNHKEARSSFLSVGSPKLQSAGGQALRSKQYLDLQSQQAALHPAAGSVGSESGELGPAALNSWQLLKLLQEAGLLVYLPRASVTLRGLCNHCLPATLGLFYIYLLFILYRLSYDYIFCGTVLTFDPLITLVLRVASG